MAEDETLDALFSSNIDRPVIEGKHRGKSANWLVQKLEIVLSLF
jgi:hypothetical protein